MDVYEAGGIGLSVDDLLDLPTDDFLSHHLHPPDSCLPSSSATAAAAGHFPPLPVPFNDILCGPPAEDAAELEWLSNYMDDDDRSFADYPPNSLTAAAATFHSSSSNKLTQNKLGRAGSDAAARRCTHCASEKTPQWRTGPLGPKTLCNACGVRYKSGRLVPEYRPAASPTFVLTQHSNSHRKVLELRRQKEMLHRQRQQAAYGRHFPLLNV